MSAKPVILVVDDDLPIVTLMRSLLHEFGFEPVTATTGNDAIARAQERTPDLVLLDKNMPGMNGEQVIRAMRAAGLLAQTPVLILSGEPVGADELARIGATAAVQKPFDVMALVQKIRTFVRVTP